MNKEKEEEMIKVKIQLFREFQAKIRNELILNSEKVIKLGGEDITGFNLELLAGANAELINNISLVTKMPHEELVSVISKITVLFLKNHYNVEIRPENNNKDTKVLH